MATVPHTASIVCNPEAKMPSFPEIQIRTKRLRLRPLAKGDELQLFGIHSNPEFMRYWSSPPWTSVDQAVALITRDLVEMAQGQQIRLGIFLSTTEEMIGTCTLFKLDRQCRRAEIGYGIAREFWRQGFMAEAVSALLEFGFMQMHLNRVEADIDPRNTASGKSLEKLGFVREGYLRERWIVGDEVSDSALYGLLRKDWNSMQRADVA